MGQNQQAARLKKLLKQYPAADANKDGKLTWQEAIAYREKMQGGNPGKAAEPKQVSPQPTHENLRYGKWDRNVLDLWVPDSEQPTPLIVFIHGGGFTGGKKEQVRGTGIVSQALKQKVAFAAIHYRFRYPDSGDTSDPQRAGLPDILRDSARAIQFLRHHANDYNLAPERIACYGGSAGAGTSIWLAFHDDLADPDHEDPVLRQSTRISAAGMLNGQFTYDLAQWDQEFKEFGGDLVKTHGRDGKIATHKFLGLTEAEYDGETGKRVRADVDMRGMISADDPPVYLMTSLENRQAASRNIYNHHPLHATLIQQRCEEKGVETLCLLPKVRDEDQKRMKENPDLMLEFFFKHLNVSPL